MSLGTNCEVSFRIQDFTGGGGIDSYIFSWTALYDPIRAIDALKNLPMLKESDWMASKTRMVINNKFEIGFHFRDLCANLFDDKGNLNQEEFDEGLEELLSRMAHLIEKTEHLFANDDDQDVLFVFKTEFYKPEYKKYHNVLYVISYLYAVLKEKFISRSRDFFLLVLSDDKTIVNKVNCAHIADNILMQHIMFYPDNTKRKTGGDKLGWNCAFNNALLAFRYYKLSKYTNNISPRLDNGHWTITKSGDAQGEFNSITRTLRCSSESNCYFGITHDLDISQHIGKTLLLSLHISKIQSVRDDVGYFQIWENRINEPKKTVSTFLLSVHKEN